MNDIDLSSTLCETDRDLLFYNRRWLHLAIIVDLIKLTNDVCLQSLYQTH